MSLRTVSLAFALLLIAGISSGCASKRVITAKAWTDSKGYSTLYTTYWEGKCMGNSCTRGSSKVKQCVLQTKDNSLLCEESESAEAALNP